MNDGGPSRGEILCRALHARGLSPDWYLLSASQQIAMQEAGESVKDELGGGEEAERELEELKFEIDKEKEDRADRAFGMYVDDDGPHVTHGDKELGGVKSFSIEWKGEEIAIKLVVDRDPKDARRESLIVDMRDAEIEIEEVDPPAPKIELSPKAGSRRGIKSK